MPTEVVLTEAAKSDIMAVKNTVIIARIYKLVERLKGWPRVSGAKPLTGKLAGKYRMRTGDYRLQFRVETKRVKEVVQEQVGGKTVKETKEVQHCKVIVEKAGHRDGFYDD